MCDPCRTQTYNPLIRSQVLYSIELMDRLLEIIASLTTNTKLNLLSNTFNRSYTICSSCSCIRVGTCSSITLCCRCCVSTSSKTNCHSYNSYHHENFLLHF